LEQKEGETKRTPCVTGLFKTDQTGNKGGRKGSQRDKRMFGRLERNKGKKRLGAGVLITCSMGSYVRRKKEGRNFGFKGNYRWGGPIKYFANYYRGTSKRLSTPKREGEQKCAFAQNLGVANRAGKRRCSVLTKEGKKRGACVNGGKSKISSNRCRAKKKRSHGIGGVF